MFDQLIFVTMAGAIVIAILALIKVMIDYPGFGDWCMRAIHKKTAAKEAAEAVEEGESFEEIVLVGDDKVEAVKTSEKTVDKIDPAILRVTMSRTNTDPELCKRRLEDEIISLDEGTPDSGGRKSGHHHEMRRHSHDHHHHRHHRHHGHRKHSHDYHHHHHHHSGHVHHSSTDIEHSDQETRRKKRYTRRAGLMTDSPHDSSGTSHEAVDLASADNKHSMRIAINNVNILINRHVHKDVTINIDMEEGEGGEVGVECPMVEHDHDHLHHDDHEVRSSDSGIGWDEHQVHDAEVHESHDIHHPGDIEPIEEERETERNVIVESDNSEAKDIFNKLDPLPPVNLPKRYRHNTFS